MLILLRNSFLQVSEAVEYARAVIIAAVAADEAIRDVDPYTKQPDADRVESTLADLVSAVYDAAARYVSVESVFKLVL